MEVETLRDMSLKATSDSQRDKNSVVIGLILERVDEEDLFNCRLVSRHWNEEVVRYLTQIPESLTDNVRANCIWHRKFYNNFDKIATTSRNGGKTLTDFHLLLEDSKHPEVLLKVVEISRKIVKSFNPSPFPKKILEAERILLKFGNHVKRLVVESDKDFIVSTRCLGQNGFCPNLQELCYTMHEDCGDGYSSFLQPFLNNIGILKLKKLEFSYTAWAVYNRKSMQALLMFFRGIVENSSELEYLKIQTIEGTGASRWNTHQFLEVLQSLPLKTRNLKKFHLEGEIMDNFPNLCLIEFEKSLKAIDLTEQDNLYGFQRTKDEHQKWLGKFLSMVNVSLESFKLNISKLKRSYQRLSLNDVPCMPQLTQFTFSASTERVNCLDFLKKCPSLRTLSISGLQTLREVLEDCSEEREVKSESGNCLPYLVHGQLERISVGVTLIHNPITLENVNVALPNLSRLEIELVHPAGFLGNRHTIWIQNSFKEISKMKNLQSLFIKFRAWWEYEHVGVDLREAFLYLKETPNLVQLSLVGARSDKFIGKWIAVALFELAGAPKLRRIFFDCFPGGIRNLFLKWKMAQMMEDFARLNIDFTIY